MAVATKKAKRQRHVFDGQMVCHLWANQSQDGARNASQNIFFAGETIYSYGHHFPMAHHVQNDRENAAILFSTAAYSVTTSKHQRWARGAARHRICFNVPSIGTCGPVDHGDNLEYYQRTIADLAEKARRAREHKRSALTALNAQVEEARRYAAFFGLSAEFAYPIDMAAELAKAAQLESAAEAKSQERNRKRDEANQQAIAPWVAGESDHCPWTFGDVKLRIKGEEIQTSKGARVPLSHAIRLIPMIRAGKAYQRNGHSVHVGHFAVDAVDEQGNLRAGCHFIKREEMERIAQELGL